MSTAHLHDCVVAAAGGRWDAKPGNSVTLWKDLLQACAISVHNCEDSDLEYRSASACCCLAMHSIPSRFVQHHGGD